MSESLFEWSWKKFDGTCFRVWKFQMTLLLKVNEVWDVVDGSRIMPVMIAEHEAATKLWEKDNAKAMLLIWSSLEDELLQRVLRCPSAKEMWEKVISIHRQKTNKLGLMIQFFNYRMDPNDTVTEHVAKIENLAGELEDVGEELSSLMIVAKVLVTLPSKFNMFRTCWDSVSPERQTLDVLRERLIWEEARLTAHCENNKDAKPRKPRRR